MIIRRNTDSLPRPSEQTGQHSPSGFSHISEILPIVMDALLRQVAQQKNLGTPSSGDRGYRLAA